MNRLQSLLETRKRATALRAEGRPEEALELLRKAGDKWPDHPALIADQAAAWVEMQDFPQADLSISRLLELSGDAATWNFVADLESAMRRTGRALAGYDRLLALDPQSLDGWLKKMEILERLGRLDDAQAAMENVLRLDASSERGRFMRALLSFRRGLWELAGERLQDLLGSGLKDREIQWKAGHQLAATLEKTGDFKNSMLVLQAVKSGMENDYAKEIAIARRAFRAKSAAIRQLTAQLTKRHIESWREFCGEDMPVTILAGHPRSGTTLLESVLVRHSGIASVEETTCMENAVFRAVYGVAAAEPGLFDVDFLNGLGEDVRATAQRNYLNSTRGYLDPAQAGKKSILDKNPMLTHFLGVAARFFPQTKSIVALRDPRDVCLSCYQQPVGVMTSNVAWLRLEDTMHAYNDIMGVWLKMRRILPNGWLEVRYEDLVEQTEATARRALDFLGLPWEEAVLASRDGERVIHSPTYAEASKPVYRSAVGRWETHEEILSPHLPVLRASIDALGY